MAIPGSMPLFVLLLALGVFSPGLFPPVSSLSDDNLSTYQVLESYNFPIGILPKGALGYELDRATGKFKAYLNGPSWSPAGDPLFLPPRRLDLLCDSFKN
ncbi:hypothetical protein H6P81_015174 [Aristolochia fimbriata]|uniref:Uncharacterized protein n=1 Tax=Aristolochia fimbriata TaxID=158543 RepID=A0AAV7E5F8_ARIFI|nr:hypothetical protein H6P81_015174 [Aristolochia fimbriata]